MNSKFYIILLFALSITYNGQGQDWNLDFEEWDDSITSFFLIDSFVNDRVGIHPLNWYSHPDFIPEGTGVGQTSDAVSGEFALALSAYYQYPVMRITTGTSPNDSGWPIGYRPKELNGQYKVINLGVGNVSILAYVDIILTKYNIQNQKRDTIGQGHIILTETVNEYMDFNMQIDYQLNNQDIPDSVTIILAEERIGLDSQTECYECGHVFFDNFSIPPFTSTLDANESGLNGFECYPNPTSDQLKILNTSTKAKYFKILDVMGRICYYGLIDNNSETVIETRYIDGSFLFISDGTTSKKVILCK
jgi:hypothetical protein